jgi:ribosomal protein S12 methylthiotransferase accessory factor
MIKDMQTDISIIENTSLDILLSGDSRRVCRPEETFERVMKLAPVMGITRIANVTGLDTIGVPVYTAHRPNSRSLSVTQGKGCTHIAAKVSALMEAVETYHAETIDLPLRLNSLLELNCGHGVVDVMRLPRFKENDFNPYARILWVGGYDLISEEERFIPYEMVHLDYRLPLPSGHGCFMLSSNGLASGNHVLEAVIHGICEIIERDALTLWYLKTSDQQRQSKVDLSTIDDHRCTEIINRFYDAGVNVGVWEITNDVGVPAFLCRILPDVTSDISHIRPASGMGCHLSRGIALLRALTEAAQSRLTFISGVRDDLSREDYKKFLSPDEYAKWKESIQDNAFIPRNFRAVESFESLSLSGDLDILLDRLKKVGIQEVVYVDLTKPGFNIPVVRVVIPGLEAPLERAEMLLGQRAGRMMKMSGGT